MIEELKDFLVKQQPFTFLGLSEAIAVFASVLLFNEKKQIESTFEFDGKFFLCSLKMQELSRDEFEKITNKLAADLGRQKSENRKAENESKEKSEQSRTDATANN